MKLLIRNDDVDIVRAAQTVVRHRQQAVGIGGEVDARNFRALIGDHIQETGVLVAEAVVVLAPDDGSDQYVQ